ncbi:MAG: hypothetical protein DHS20C12_16130 [Pseudohongiella sp.]|nr:MAG: hypothetical protein DHS20C12_16130 [Pseudohongiella sp.]
MQPVKILILLQCFVISVPARAQFLQDSPELERLAEANEIVAEIESVSGPYEPALLEPLDEIAQTLMQLGEHAQAHAILDRAFQIARIDGGLYTPNQLPYLHRKIDNFANWGDWERVQELTDHLSWLYINKELRPFSVVIEGFTHIGQAHTRGIYEDVEDNREFHFRVAELAFRNSVAGAGALYGETDPRLVPLLYNRLIHNYLQAAAVREGTIAGNGLRRVATGQDYKVSRWAKLNSYYVDGQNLLHRIREIYLAQAEPDLEAAAIAQLYLADWHVLFDKRESAMKCYGEAHRSMLSAAVDAARVDQIFSTPVILPEREFYASVEQTLLARSGELASSANAASPLLYNERVRLPFDEHLGLIAHVDDMEAAEDSLSASDVARVSVFVKGLEEVITRESVRRIVQVGVAQSIDILELSEDAPLNALELEEKARRLRFRPILNEGIPQHWGGVLRYELVGGY